MNRYVGPLVNSYARSQGVSGGLVLKPPKVADGGGNLDFSFKPSQEGASFDDKSWSASCAEASKALNLWMADPFPSAQNSSQKKRTTPVCRWVLLQ